MDAGKKISFAIITGSFVHLNVVNEVFKKIIKWNVKQNTIIWKQKICIIHQKKENKYSQTC